MKATQSRIYTCYQNSSFFLRSIKAVKKNRAKFINKGESMIITLSFISMVSTPNKDTSKWGGGGGAKVGFQANQLHRIKWIVEIK